MDRGRRLCTGVIDGRLEIGGRVMSLSFIVAEQLIDGVDAILGMDVVCASGACTLAATTQSRF